MNSDPASSLSFSLSIHWSLCFRTSSEAGIKKQLADRIEQQHGGGRIQLCPHIRMLSTLRGCRFYLLLVFLLLPKSPYDSFMRKHLQHYGYFTGENPRVDGERTRHVVFQVEVKSSRNMGLFPRNPIWSPHRVVLIRAPMKMDTQVGLRFLFALATQTRLPATSARRSPRENLGGFLHLVSRQTEGFLFLAWSTLRSILIYLTRLVRRGRINCM